MFKPKLSKPLSAACIAALMAFAASRPALAFVQNPEKPVGGFLVPTGLDVYTANFLRHTIRVDTRYPEWRDLFYIYTLGQTYIDALKWNGNIVKGCGGNEFQMEVATGSTPPEPQPYWSLPDSNFRTATPDGKGGLIYTERPTRPGVCADLPVTGSSAWQQGGPAPLGRVWWDTVTEAFSYRTGRPVRAFRAGNTHLIHGGPLTSKAHVCSVQYNGVDYAGSYVYPICAVQVREGNGDMVQRSFIDGNSAGTLRGAKIQILMDTQLTGTQWTTNPELQDKLAVTLPPLPGEKLPRKLCEAKLPTVYKNTNPVAVGWTDDTGRCHVPQELDPKLYADPTKAIVLKPGSYRVLIAFKYVLAGVGDAATADPALYSLWNKVRWEYQD